jgi:DNA replication ATP-dependent helicase Dna2
MQLSSDSSPPPAGSPALYLTGTRVAEFFRFACERQLRYDLVPEAARGEEVPRTGYDAERGVWVGPRPGAGLLAVAGTRWEQRRLRQLARRLGPERVLSAGWKAGGAPRRLPAERVVEALRDPGTLEVLFQPELMLPDPEAFARRFGLDPSRVGFGPAVPDLIRIRRLRSGALRFQVIDIKASAEGRISHFAQVAFYSLVLDALCEAEGIEGGRADRRWGRIWARDGRGPQRFPLAAYRHHVEEMLRRDLPRVAEAPPADAAWHLSPRCGGCSYLAHCRAEGDGRDDLARVAGITPLAKRVLHERGIRTVRQMTDAGHRKDTYRGCHALESQAERLGKRAQAVRYGKVFEVETRTHLMPASEDVRVILSAEGDPVTGLCFALGLRVDAEVPLQGAPPLGIWIAGSGTATAERSLLDSLLASLERAIGAVAAYGRSASLHFYVADRVEFELLRGLLVRHLADEGSRPGIARLLRFLSPRAVSLQPEVLRSSPGTLVSEVVSALFALPVPYAYDLAAVSDRLRPSRGDWAFAPRAGYAWPFSSQVAFERIHNVWRGKPFGDGEDSQDPEEVLEEIRRTIASKLKATDSVIRAIRERAVRRERLQLRKEPLALLGSDESLADPTLETLRVFAELESAAEAISTRALHILPAAERARRLECIRGLSLVERREDRSLVFEFDPECRDAKFRAGDFSLVLTTDDDRSLLETDRLPWKRRALMVELIGYDLSASPPRVVLAPGSGFAKAEERGWIHLDRMCVLDRAPSDFSTARILATLRSLAEGRGESAAVLGLLRGEAPVGWIPPCSDVDAVRAEVLERGAALLGRPVLNSDQEHAWRAALARPVSLVWGPPGTGKTYLLAWTLIGLAAAARREGRPCRILVAAATHRAIVNVLAKLSAELTGSGVEVPLRAVKLRGSGSEAEADLEGTVVEGVPDTRLPALLAEAESSGEALVVGSTAWSLWKRMRAASGDDTPLQSWFDVVVVDEASQMKVSEALIAMSSMRPGAQLVLCGDDKQLSPVVRGRYSEEAGTLFGSVFGHMAGHFPRLALRESRRMNRALVAYPRELFYPGLVSMVPDRRVSSSEAPLAEPGDELLRDLFLRPEDAVVFCTYRGVRATARNPFEARLAARIARVARECLLDPRTGEPYDAAEFAAEALAVLSPHRAQNSAILAEMQRAGMPAGSMPVVDTVERMQGNEREVILVSYAVADREYAEAEAEFLLDPNRFNVSITRARSKLVVLVSEEVLDALPADEAVLSGSMAIKGYRAHCRDGVREVRLPGPDGEPVALRLHVRSLRPPPPRRLVSPPAAV